MSKSRIFIAIVCAVALVVGLRHEPSEAQGTKQGKFKKPTATPIELIKVKKDFKVELLYSVPRETQGSWVNMTVDPKGRLITSDQYGRALPHHAPARSAATPKTPKSRCSPSSSAKRTACSGLSTAFTSSSTRAESTSRAGCGASRPPRTMTCSTRRNCCGKSTAAANTGLTRSCSGPDEKSLYVLHGNHTRPIKADHTTVPPIWGEDFLVPRLWDASGHAVGIMAPAGCIYKTDKDGKEWTLISMGYRNEFDAAFNRDGELFTFDADMEWDMNLPWYRPTRVCHAVPGSEFGWRGGTGKMYEYMPDNLPPVVNVGPGSPTGIDLRLRRQVSRPNIRTPSSCATGASASSMPAI